MTMRRLTRLWNSLDELPSAATDQRDWIVRLGDAWASAAQLLRRTGHLAHAVACPSPGGENCPRRVVRHPDGRIRAVCGDPDTICDSLDLTLDDIAILALDVAKLVGVIARTLSISGVPHHPRQGPVVHIGRHEVFAGRGIPVFLALTGPQVTDLLGPFCDVVAAEAPKLVLTPTVRSLTSEQRRYLDENSATLMALDDILIADTRHAIVAARPAEDLLSALRAEIEEAGSQGAAKRAWNLPPDARWEEMVIEFTAAEVINVVFRGETRRFEPEHLGMKSAKNGRPTLQWTLLQTIAVSGGRLSWQHPGAAQNVKKQKQQLKAKLHASFGISTDPIPWSERQQAYVAAFTARGDVLARGRARCP